MPDDFKLTAKQKAFAEYYVSFGAENAVITKAALAAGYSPTSAAESGCENLKKSNVKSYIDKMQAPARKKAQKKYEITLDKLIAEAMDLHATCKDKLSDDFDAAAVNAGRSCLEFVAKVSGLATDKIQLQADINNRHSVDMIRTLEVDTTSRDALRLLLDRQRSTIQAGDVQQ